MAKKSILKGGVFGVVIGAVGGLLFAPKSGKNTRKEIKKAATKANSEAEKRLKELHVELKERAEDATKMAGEAKGKAREELDDLAKRAEFARVKIGELITSVREFEVEDKEVEAAIKDGKKVVGKIEKTTKKK